MIAEALPFVSAMVMFGGGEPTLASHLPEIIEMAAHHHCHINMVTNGTRLTHTRLPWHLMSRLGVSMDGVRDKTVRLLRSNANVNYILDGIREVRGQAPHLTIWSKITLSRTNLEELPEIVSTLADVGVNEVIVQSLCDYHSTHIPMQVRVSDRPFAEERITRAREVAAERGLVFQSLVTFDQFAVPDGEAHDITALHDYLTQLPVPAQKVAGLDAVKRSMQSMQFSFYPAALEQDGNGRWALESKSPNGSGAVRDEGELDRHIRVLARQAASAPARLPYCFMPWKLPYVDPDGGVRVCDLLGKPVGNLDDHPDFASIWNSPDYVQLRTAMFQTELLPDTCKKCVSFCRSNFSNDTVALADILGLDVRQHTAFPASADLPRQLAAAPVHRRIDAHPPARKKLFARHTTYVLPAEAQLMVRFPNPRVPAYIYYRWNVHLSGGRLLAGIKPVNGSDLWNYMLDARMVHDLTEWSGIPMPPVPIDFSQVPDAEVCLFLWAPHENVRDIEVAVKDFQGLRVVTAERANHDLNHNHLLNRGYARHAAGQT